MHETWHTPGSAAWDLVSCGDDLPLAMVRFQSLPSTGRHTIFSLPGLAFVPRFPYPRRLESDNMAEFVIENASLTDLGRKRRQNEDYIGQFEPTDAEELGESGRLYIVADGVGGGAAGEVASEYAVRKVLHEYFRSTEADLGERLRAAVRAAHTDLHDHVERHPEMRQMGTTMVAAAVHGEQLTICNVGDSRAYLIRHGQIRQITQDHSLVAQLVDEGSITAEEAENHPRRNVVLRSIGVESSVHPDIFEGQLQVGDQIVLCSDGLTRHVSDEEILRVVTRTRADRAVKQLVAMANVRGGKDNISVSLLRMIEAVPLATLVEREAKRQELLVPELNELQHTARRRLDMQEARQRAPFPRRQVPVWMWLAMGAVTATLVLAGCWLVATALQATLKQPETGQGPWKQVAIGGLSLALVLAVLLVLVILRPAAGQAAVQLRGRARYWFGGGIVLAAALIVVLALLSGGIGSLRLLATETPSPTPSVVPTYTPRRASAPAAIPPTPVVTATQPATSAASATATPLPAATSTTTATEMPTAAPSATNAATPLPARSVPPTQQAVSPAVEEISVRDEDSMEMVYVPAGEFVMGSTDAEVDDALALCENYVAGCNRGWFENEEPARMVALGAFRIDRREVTNGQYHRSVEAGACTQPTDSSSVIRDSYCDSESYDDYPVIYVSWHQAADYRAWAGPSTGTSRPATGPSRGSTC
jgi:serine/threonine protein phosphatase PrpC